MTKVHEALIRARADRDLVRRLELGEAMGERKPQLAGSGGLPPTKMEKEMGRLFHNVCGLLPNSQRGVIQFIGSQREEGTSTIVREFALFLASKTNKSTLLIDAHRTHAPQYQALAVSSASSLEWTLNYGRTVDEAVCQVRGSQVFLTTLFEKDGEKVPAEAAFNQSQLWNKLRKCFDFILIDSPPMAVSDDAFSLCSSTDGVILVVEAEKTRSRVVTNLKARVVQSEGRILGLVFNKQRYYIPEWLYKRL